MLLPFLYYFCYSFLFSLLLCCCAVIWFFRHQFSSMSALVSHSLSLSFSMCMCSALDFHFHYGLVLSDDIINTYIHIRTHIPRNNVDVFGQSMSYKLYSIIIIIDENSDAVSMQLAVVWQRQANEILNESIEYWVWLNTRAYVRTFVLFSYDSIHFAACYQINERVRVKFEIFWCNDEHQ